MSRQQSKKASPRAATSGARPRSPREHNQQPTRHSLRLQAQQEALRRQQVRIMVKKSPAKTTNEQQQQQQEMIPQSGSVSGSGSPSPWEEDENEGKKQIITTPSPPAPGIIKFYREHKIMVFVDRANNVVSFDRRRDRGRNILQFYYKGELIALADLDAETYMYEKAAIQLVVDGNEPWAQVYRGDVHVASRNLVTGDFLSMVPSENGRLNVVKIF